MKIKYAVILFFVMCCTACAQRQFSDNELVSFLNEYREAKSLDYAMYGKRWGTDELDKKYMHRDIITMANSFKPEIYVLKNEFLLDGVEIDNADYFVKKYGKNKIYDLHGTETIFAKIEHGKMVNLPPPFTRTGAYGIATDTGKPQIFLDGMWNAYYVLEKDVPILLKRLKETGASY